MASVPTDVDRPSRPEARASLTQGLSRAEAASRLAAEGANELEREERTSRLRMLLRQLEGPMILLLLGATAVSALLGEVADATAIALIVILNAVVGFLQEYRAEEAILALRSMTAPRARVMREGTVSVVPAREIVRGDVLVLEAGDVVAADARLLRAHALATVEASLTGESEPADKRVGEVPPGAPLAERFDSVFLGTQVARGTGLAEVFATGMATELGKIAHLLSVTKDSRTPLEQRLAEVGAVLLKLCLALVVVVAGVDLVRGRPVFEVLLSAVSLAVAAVPEGLAAVVTVALALGVQRMAARHVLVRKLASVETLGCATVVCTDKTGTLTAGEMSVREIVSSDPEELLRAAASCCDADLEGDAGKGSGDPTELAILRRARAHGIERARIEVENPRVHDNPFDADRKRMSIARADGKLYVKGAPELLLPLCRVAPDDVLESNSRLAGRGLRVLAVAVGDGLEENDLVLLGLVGLADPPRPEAIEAVRVARRAGIHTVMITGDHGTTALSIAREMGIVQEGEDAAERVHARATPEDKLRIVKAWKERGAIVAMTGDGVNDAPALREAHIGIAMGRTGTEVTREASDMVLADDDFASIVAAIREGRGIYDNIRKTLVYLLTGNFGELALMFGASVLGLPFPLLPLHLLYINLVTDGLPALALVADPTAADVLDRPPRPTDEPMLGGPQWRSIVVAGLLEAGVALSFFVFALDRWGLERARPLVFTFVVFAEILRSLVARSRDRIFPETGPFTNRALLAVIVGSIALQITITAVPFTARLFGLEHVGLRGIGLALVLALASGGMLEMVKLVRRGYRRLAG